MRALTELFRETKCDEEKIKEIFNHNNNIHIEQLDQNLLMIGPQLKKVGFSSENLLDLIHKNGAMKLFIINLEWNIFSKYGFTANSISVIGKLSAARLVGLQLYLNLLENQPNLRYHPNEIENIVKYLSSTISDPSCPKELMKILKDEKLIARTLAQYKKEMLKLDKEIESPTNNNFFRNVPEFSTHQQVKAFFDDLKKIANQFAIEDLKKIKNVANNTLLMVAYDIFIYRINDINSKYNHTIPHLEETLNYHIIKYYIDAFFEPIDRTNKRLRVALPILIESLNPPKEPPYSLLPQTHYSKLGCKRALQAYYVTDDNQLENTMFGYAQDDFEMLCSQFRWNNQLSAIINEYKTGFFHAIFLLKKVIEPETSIQLINVLLNFNNISLSDSIPTGYYQYPITQFAIHPNIASEELNIANITLNFPI